MSFDHDLFDRVTKQLQPPLVRSLRRKCESHSDAEDLAQTVYLRVLLTRPDIDDETALRKYIWATARNLARTAGTRRSRERALLAATGAESIAELADPDAREFADLVATRIAVHQAIATLPAREREAVTLRYCRDLTCAETAAAMGLATGTVKAYLHASARRLRYRLAAPEKYGAAAA
ncbi:RNA polymerase sigma factor [Nocardia crassostreae]|uniref:RNA polymerase sigma factor n=1 Tax=Nocardia crassostreae TaxID=53428 RepID=UPI0014713173|nr:RNA polymerase sigma factor [Nocardia crassostreae]